MSIGRLIIINEIDRHTRLYTNQQPPQRGGAIPDPVWVGSKWLLDYPRVPDTPGTPLYFFAMLPLNDRNRAEHSFFKIGRFLLMSGNIHPNPGPIFPCSLCAGNVTWRGKSVQCITCSKWAHLRCSILSLSKFRTLGSSHSWSCPLP